MTEAVLPPIDEEGRARLLGSRCPDCGECFFPARDRCNNCGFPACEAWEFGPEGVLYTFTVVREPPGLPPRAFGQVDFEGRVRVQARIVAPAPEEVRIGAAMEVVAGPAGEAGTSGFAFRGVQLK